MDAVDERFMERAVELARRAESEGNLPIGAVIALGEDRVAEGRNRVVEPSYNPGRHAEMEAIDGVDSRRWERAREMTCYTTLEPCVMCTGALLQYGIGRVVFGARDEEGGGGAIRESLPPLYREREWLTWEGPVREEECGRLSERAREMFEALPVVPQTTVEDDEGGTDIEALHEELDDWLDDRVEYSVQDARQRVGEWVEALEVDEIGRALPYAGEVFRRGGYLKDYRNLEEWARRADQTEALDRVEETLRRELPDVWVRRSLQSGDAERAVSRWFEVDEHPRARHVADELVEHCGEGRPQLVISCRLAQVGHLARRGGRRQYRRACGILRRLRDELDRAGESGFWRHVVDQIRDEYANRPAFLDELAKAGFE